MLLRNSYWIVIQIALFVQLQSLLNNVCVFLNLVVQEQALLTFIINKALDIDVNVYSNSDVAVCIKCYKSLVKYQKAGEHVKKIKSELKSSYSASGRRVKRLLRTENITAGSGTSVKKHLSFVSLNEFPTTCSSSNLTPSSWALPRLTISPMGKPQGCLFDNGTFSLVRSAFAAPFVTSSPKIKQTSAKKWNKDEGRRWVSQ